MKILTPREFKLQNPDAYLDDYLAYLEKMQQDAEETLQNATTLIRNENIIRKIQSQAEEIYIMAALVEDYMGQIVLKSIDTLPLEELQEYFDFTKENKASEARKVELEDERKNIEDRLEEINEQIESELYLKGRVKSFYEVEDADKFFAQDEGPHDFIENLISTLSVESTFESAASELSKQLTLTLETECKIQNVGLTSDEISELCAKIMELFKKLKNIIKYSPEAKNQVALVVLSDAGIKQFLPEGFDEKTATNLMYDLMNLKKLNTAFYQNLPSPLKVSLELERLQGEPYDKLLRAYQAFLNGEDLPSDDLSQEEKDEKKKLEDKLGQVNTDLTAIEDERKFQQEFLENEAKMRSSLRERIAKMIGKQVTAQDIDSIVSAEETRIAKLKSELSEASSLLSVKVSDLEKAKSIILDPNYHEFFQAVELNNVRRIYQFFGVEMKDEVMIPFLDTEKRRFEQFDIMIDFQNKLDSIYNAIRTQKGKSNFITRLLPSYKESLRTQDEQYHNEEKLAYEIIKENGLFSVNAPRIDAASTVGNIIVLEPLEFQVEPENFSEISGLNQILWNMPTGVDENTKKKFLATSTEFDNWDDYYQDLIKRHAELVSKLFSYAKNEEGYYTFACTAEERETLKGLQTTIIEILTSIYEERKAFRERLGDSAMPLDSDKVAELEYFLGTGLSLSRENLAVYIEQTEAKVAKLRRLFADNYTVCSKLGIAIPEGITPNDEARKDDSKELNERIQGLQIEGVTNLEEAINHRDILLGFEEYNVPAARVRQYYSSHRN